MAIDLTTDIQGSSADEPAGQPDVSGDQTLIPVDEIVVVGQRRSLQQDKVADLVESIRTLGLLSPIAVRRVGGAKEAPDAREDSGSYQLVYGLHRLTAVRQLGWKEIPCRVFSSSEVKLGMPHLSDMADDDRHALMAEIAENLHRAELTALERAEHIAHWLRLKWGVRQPPGEKSPEVKGKGRGRPHGGRSAAAREIGISEPDARRSEKIAALPDEVKAEAKVLGLDDNQAALLKATVAPDPITALRGHVASPERGSGEELHPPADPAPGAVSAELKAAMEAIRRLGSADRNSLLWWIRVTYGSAVTGRRRWL
jgi:ParB/RepB/Spo0J family partition protein